MTPAALLCWLAILASPVLIRRLAHGHVPLKPGATVLWLPGCLAVCALAIFASLFYVGRVIHVTVEPSFLWYNFCGVLFGMSLVIPGLTSSSVMMALGLYQPMLAGLARLDLLVLSACLPGMVIAMLLLARLVSWFFRRHYAVAYHGILGIVLASTLVIVPTAYTGWGEVVLSALCCAGGFWLASFLDKLDRRSKAGPD